MPRKAWTSSCPILYVRQTFSMRINPSAEGECGALRAVSDFSSGIVLDRLMSSGHRTPTGSGHMPS